MRAALYFLPRPTSPLWSKGSRLIGYDAATGETYMPISLGVLSPVSVWQLTEEPRRYGLHATLKAPFSLAPGRTVDQLVSEVRSFSAKLAMEDGIDLSISLLNGFAALTLTRPREEVNRLAAECVIALDDFRAPLSTDERRRRMASPLTEAQISLMDRWGYPYVLDEFRFHLTLTNVLPSHFEQPVLSALRNYFSSDDLSTRIDAISVCTQSSPTDRFREYARIPLGAGEVEQKRFAISRKP